MSSERDLAGAWEAVRLVLDATGLRTYLFRVAYAKKDWVIDLEHPRGGVWCAATLRAAREELLAAIDDGKQRAALAAKWRRTLELSHAA
jgi:hypothetical protein